MGAKEWTAELAIPFASLGVAAPVAGRIWGHTLIRNDSESKCISCFSPPYPVSNAHATERYGFLYFQPAGQPSPVLPLEIRFQPGLPTGEPDARVAWGQNTVWVRLANLATEARNAEILLRIDGKDGARQAVELKGGEDRFVPVRAAFTHAGQASVEAIVVGGAGLGLPAPRPRPEGRTTNKEDHRIGLAVDVLPLLVGKLASDLYFTGEPSYMATVRFNGGDPKMKDRELFFGVRPAKGGEYLRLGRLGQLKTGSARFRLAMGDLGAGEYALDTGIVSEDGKTQTMSSFPFRLEKTPYDF